ncbi:hypothetical protein V5799_007632 [Amblyomma americanum]|uniref:Large ribosomal subunit protein eL28 n=2 Tax=Amblyomma americanum TaxID=6943 RepID=A0AAQ4FGT1_AMBAM
MLYNKVIITMSAELQWMIVKNRSSFLVKKRMIKTWFSIDPLNPKGTHAKRYSGIVRDKALTIEPHVSGKGVTLVYKKQAYRKKPAKLLDRVDLMNGARRTMTSIKKWVKGHKYYRKDLQTLCMRRASAILRSQKAIVPKKKTPRPTKKAD